MAAGDEQDGPRETAAGLQRGDGGAGEHGDTPVTAKANPATQQDMVDDRSTPDEQSTRAKSQKDDKVTAENWNQ